MRKIVVLAMVMLVIPIFAHQALAEETGEKKKPWDKLNLNLGWFFTNLDSSVRIGSETLGAGIEVDVEEALGLESNTNAFRADLQYRVGKNMRHRLELGYLVIDRTSSKKLGQDIEWKDETITVGTTVKSVFNIQIYRGGYRYSLFQDDRIDFGVGLGLFVMPVKLGIDADGIDAQETEITAPLPTLSLNFDFAFTPKWFLKQRIDAFYLAYDRFTGTLLDTMMAVEYNAFKNVGFGVMWDSFRFRFKAKGEDYPTVDFSGEISFDYSGFMLYGKLYY